VVTFSIGEPGPKTDLGYPASGSFVEFLIEVHGLAAFKEIYRLQGATSTEAGAPSDWQQVYGKTLQQLEEAWIPWLEQRLGI
jgi:hypothetical protein